jgi:hypothetical protein
MNAVAHWTEVAWVMVEGKVKEPAVDPESSELAAP